MAIDAFDVRLEMTCGACPEQYDAFVGDELIGYLRLRGGWFRVDYGGCGGPTIYEAEPEGDGSFMDHEAARYLHMAKTALADEYNRRGAA